MGVIGYIAGTVAIGTMFGVVALWASQRRSRKERNGARNYPHGGEMGDLNKLLQEGTISPEEY